MVSILKSDKSTIWIFILPTKLIISPWFPGSRRFFRRPPRRPRRAGAGVPTARGPAGRADGAGGAHPEPRWGAAGGIPTDISRWWFGTSILFSHILGIIIPIEINWPIFFRGVQTTNQWTNQYLFWWCSTNLQKGPFTSIYHLEDHPTDRGHGGYSPVMISGMILQWSWISPWRIGLFHHPKWVSYGPMVITTMATISVGWSSKWYMDVNGPFWRLVEHDLQTSVGYCIPNRRVMWNIGTSIPTPGFSTCIPSCKLVHSHWNITKTNICWNLYPQWLGECNQPALWGSSHG